jgi:hypothetical protein
LLVHRGNANFERSMPWAQEICPCCTPGPGLMALGPPGRAAVYKSNNSASPCHITRPHRAEGMVMVSEFGNVLNIVALVADVPDRRQTWAKCMVRVIQWSSLPSTIIVRMSRLQQELDLNDQYICRSHHCACKWLTSLRLASACTSIVSACLIVVFST